MDDGPRHPLHDTVRRWSLPDRSMIPAMPHIQLNIAEDGVEKSLE